MSYDITIVGGQIIRVSDEQGEALKELKRTGKPTETIELDDDMMELGRVKLIQKVFERKVPLHNLPAPEKARCRGKRSIQLEIMKIIKQKYPTEWPKYIRDKAYKEKLRVWLRENRKGEWCDYIAGTCVCTADFVPDPVAIKEAMSVFPNAVPIDIPEEIRGDLK
jgi:hypothetical protein